MRSLYREETRGSKQNVSQAIFVVRKDSSIVHLQQKVFLLHCLGVEVQRLFYTLPECAIVATISMEKTSTLDEFQVALLLQNVVAERCRFCQQTQLLGESVDDFVAELRSMLSCCEFGQAMGDFIQDQVESNTSSHHLRERLLERSS